MVSRWKKREKGVPALKPIDRTYRSLKCPAQKDHKGLLTRKKGNHCRRFKEGEKKPSHGREKKRVFSHPSAKEGARHSSN